MGTVIPLKTDIVENFVQWETAAPHLERIHQYAHLGYVHGGHQWAVLTTVRVKHGVRE